MRKGNGIITLGWEKTIWSNQGHKVLHPGQHLIEPNFIQLKIAVHGQGVQHQIAAGFDAGIITQMQWKIIIAAFLIETGDILKREIDGIDSRLPLRLAAVIGDAYQTILDVRQYQ